LYALYGAFSRAALISFTVGIVALVAFRVRRHRVAKVVGVVVLAWWAYQLAAERVVRFLGGNDLESVTGASGRYEIWDQVLSVNDQWWRGWGFAALKYPDGPDWALFAATDQRPAENALLQAVLMGGVVAGLLWLWLAWRALRILWEARDVAGGATIYLGIVLSVAATFSVGLSGVSSDCWWLMAAFSFATALQKSSTADPEVPGQ
jgi:O-antigen ligase